MSSLKRKAESTSANDSKKPKKDGSLTSFFGQPKITPAAGASSTNAAEAQGAVTNFNKEKWVASLTAEQKDLLKLEIDTLDPTWLAHLKDEITTPGFLSLKRFLKKEIDSKKTIFPPLEQVYSWSRHTPLNTVKVVILGQDPYHNHNQAHGLCFSVLPPTPAPPSLKNMFKELSTSIPSFKPPRNNGGLLTPWADQGILLLNTCLTVRAHEPNSHSNQGWESFTQKVIDLVAKVRTRGVVFLAWGSPAQKRCVKISGAKHVVMKSVHPSPLSASRGWFGCDHFKKTNEWLEERYGKDAVIDWSLDVVKPKPGKGTEKISHKAESAEIKKGTVHLPAVAAKNEFDDADDEDAIEALEELAKSDAIEPPSHYTPAKEKQDGVVEGAATSGGEDKENQTV